MNALSYLYFVQDMEERYQDDYQQWIDSMERDHANRYIISKRNGEYIAWQFVRSIVDNGAIGMMPGERKEVGFCPSEIVTIIGLNTRSFAYQQAILEYIEDDEFLKQPVENNDWMVF